MKHDNYIVFKFYFPQVNTHCNTAQSFLLCVPWGDVTVTAVLNTQLKASGNTPWSLMHMRKLRILCPSSLGGSGSDVLPQMP